MKDEGLNTWLTLYDLSVNGLDMDLISSAFLLMIIEFYVYSNWITILNFVNIKGFCIQVDSIIILLNLHLFVFNIKSYLLNL